MNEELLSIIPKIPLSKDMRLNNWIRCDDQMPTEDDCILGMKFITTTRIVTENGYPYYTVEDHVLRDDGNWVIDSILGLEKTIVAWMPQIIPYFSTEKADGFEVPTLKNFVVEEDTQNEDFLRVLRELKSLEN